MRFQFHTSYGCLGWITVLGGLGLALTVQAETTQPRSSTQQESPVAATIDGQEVISIREVDQLVAAITQGGDLSPALRDRMRKTALQQLIGRHIILKYLEEKRTAATETDIQAYVSQLHTKLTNQNVTWETFLDRIGLSQNEFKTSVKWKLSWDNYLRLRLSDENLQKFFEQNRQHFDGTEIKVSQILIKLPADAEPAKIQEAIDQLQKIKQQVEENRLTFQDAAEKYSQAESASLGGQLGRIPRQNAMPDVFSKTAFELNPQEISDPVVTNIGVHLVLCEEVFPGQRSRSEVEGEVRQEAIRYLFNWVVNEKKGDHQIQIMMPSLSSE
jgi:parvulin-like peptidyl-prolyl isomerase